MSFLKAKLIGSNEETNCVDCASPAGYHYNPMLDISCTMFTRNTEQTGILNTSTPKQQYKRKFSLPVFRIPSVKRENKLVSRSQSLVVEKGKSECIFSPYALTEDSDITCKETPIESDSRPLKKCLEEKLNIDSDEIMELFKKIDDLKHNLMSSQTSEEELKKQLEEKNSYIQNIKNDQTLIKENINDLTEKMKIERKEKQNYSDSLVSQIGNLKVNLKNMLNEKDDLETILDGMKSAFVIVNDKYLLLEEEFNKIKKEKDLKIEEINQLKLKMKTGCFECMNAEGTTNNCMHKFAAAASSLEEIVNEIGAFFKHMENEFHFFKTKYRDEFETAIIYISDSFHCEMTNMEKQILEGLCQLNEFCVTTNAVITEYSEDTEKLVDQCIIMCDLLAEAELEKMDLQASVLDCKNLLTEIQGENEELQYNLDKTKNRLKTYEIASEDLHNTIMAISKRLIESDNEVERLTKVINGNKLSVSLTEAKTVIDEYTLLSNETHNIDKELNNCLLELKNIVITAQSKFCNYENEVSEINLNAIQISSTLKVDDLLLKLNHWLRERSSKHNDVLSCVQMENNSLQLQLAEATENVSKLEMQKAERDVKLSEYKTKISEQTEILEHQTNTITSLHMLLNYQHKDMERVYELQTEVNDEEQMILLEAKLEQKKQEIKRLKHALEEQLERSNVSLEKGLQQDDEMLYKNDGELKLHIYKAQQNVKELENSLKMEKERNTKMEFEIDTLKYKIKQHEKEKENVQKKIYKHGYKKEENKLQKKKKKEFLLKTRTYNSRNVSNSNAGQTPVLKD